MYVHIDDTFIDSLVRLTNKEQKAVKTAVFDLIAHPKKSALHFEKLNGGTWSVRTNKEIRIIVDRNEDALILRYVDHHDDAYRWAKNHTSKIFTPNDAAEWVKSEEVARRIAPTYGKQTILLRLLSFAEKAVGACLTVLTYLRDAIKNARDEQTDPLAAKKQKYLKGVAEVRELFSISENGKAAGCYVIRGKIASTDRIRIIRGGMAIHEGRIDSLKRFKDDVREVQLGSKCGISIWNYSNIKIGDRIESYKVGKTGIHD